MKIKISVIIPVFNTKIYLEEAINSLLVQKDFLLEIIIIDDGSTDGSGQLLDNLYGKNILFKIFHTENKGQGHARNIGIKHSKGDYIYFFDSDDIVSPKLFPKFNDILNQNKNLDLFCFSGESFLDPNSSLNDINGTSELSKLAWKRKININCDNGEDAFILLKDNSSFLPGPPLYIFKKSILDTNNLEFSHIRYEDEEFTHKLFLIAGRTVVINDVLFYRRVRSGSTMQLKRTFEDLYGYIVTIEKFEELLRIYKYKSATIKHIRLKILHTVKSSIKTKVTGKIKLNREQKRIFKNSIKRYTYRNKEIFYLYYLYSTEYKLRMFKIKIQTLLTRLNK